MTAALLTWLLIATAPQAPAVPVPDPTPAYPPPTLLPNYITPGDGSRYLCTPGYTQCWRDTVGQPVYPT